MVSHVNGLLETARAAAMRKENLSRTATGAVRAPEVVFVRGEGLGIDISSRRSRNDFPGLFAQPPSADASQSRAGDARLRPEASTRPPPRWGINE